MKRIIVIMVFVAFMSGCASVHPGHYAVQLDQTGRKLKDKKTKLGLIISGSENSKLASTYFEVIDFTFENKSQNWIRINNIKVDFGDEKINKNIKFTSGNDLAVWNESTKKRNIIHDYNTELILGAITGIGVGMVAGSDNKNVQKTGAIIAVGGAASLTAHEFNKNLTKIEKAAIFPENHLFAKGFVIPPGLFVKKWILLNSQNHKETGRISDLFLEYQTENGKFERLKLNFRTSYGNRNVAHGWQGED